MLRGERQYTYKAVKDKATDHIIDYKIRRKFEKDNERRAAGRCTASPARTSPLRLLLWRLCLTKATPLNCAFKVVTRRAACMRSPVLPLPLGPLLVWLQGAMSGRGMLPRATTNSWTRRCRCPGTTAWPRARRLRARRRERSSVEEGRQGISRVGMRT